VKQDFSGRYSRAFALTFLVSFAIVSCCIPAYADDDNNDSSGKWVAAYYQNFHVYSGTYPRHLVVNGNAGKMNSLIYAFVDIRADQSGKPHCAAFDEFADYQYNFSSNISIDGTNDSFAPGALRGQVHQLQELKKQFPKLKILASVGGFSAGTKGFEAAAATPASRQAFVADCINSYINGNFGNTTGLAPIFDSGFSEQPATTITPVPGIFDGFDIDWEFPTLAQKANFVALLQEFRKQLDAKGPGHILSVALPAGQQDFSQIDLAGAARQADFVNLLTFDYSGPFNNHTGFVAPLFQTPFDPSSTFNVNFTVQSYLGAGVPSNKILMGLPFYAYGWAITGTSAPGQNGQFVAAANPNPPPAGNPPTYQGSFAIQVNPNLANVAATETNAFLLLNILPFAQLFRDPKSQTPWAFDGKNFWTYEDPQYIATKMKYARDHGLRGAFIFEEPDQLPDGSLLNTVRATLDASQDQN
jgi:chitinase